MALIEITLIQNNFTPCGISDESIGVLDENNQIPMPQYSETFRDSSGDFYAYATNVNDQRFSLENTKISNYSSTEIESILLEISRTNLMIETDSDVMVFVTVPKVWTQGNQISVRYKIYNDGYRGASLDLEFFGYDDYGVEINIYEHTYVPKYSFKTVYLTGIVPSDSEDTVGVGLKGAATVVTGALDWSYDWDYNFVQIFGPGDFAYLPASDAMSIDSGNSQYYWEGLSDDGWSIPDQYALWHCDEWDIRYLVGSWVDFIIPSTPYQVARVLNTKVYSAIEYKDINPYHDYSLADLYTIDPAKGNYKGVCDEKAILLISLLRSIGIPARYIVIGGGGYGAHAFCEIWSGYRWVHADPTNNIWNNPYFYKNSFFFYTWVQIQAYGDDSITPTDGSETDWKLACYGDFQYIVGYDGYCHYLTSNPPYPPR